MKIKDCFVLQELADDFFVVPIGEAADKLHGVIRLNETGVFIWKLLAEKEQTEEELVNGITAAFSVEKERAEQDISSFLEQIRSFDCLE